MMMIFLACHNDKESSSLDAEAILDSTEQVVVINQSAEFAAADSTGSEFVWDFGDGTQASGETVTHQWDTVGRYTLRLTAHAGSNSDVASMAVVVVPEPLENPPVQSSMLAHDGTRLFAALFDSNEVVVVENGAVQHRIPTCAQPVAISLQAGVIGVACRLDVVQRWSSVDYSLLSETVLPWGSRPAGVVVTETGEAIVALSGPGTLVSVDSAGGYADLGLALADVRALAMTGDRLAATRFRSQGDAGTILLSGQEVALARDPGPDSDTDARGIPTYLAAISFSPDGESLAVGGLRANIERGLVRDGLALTNETVTRSTLRMVGADGEERLDAGFDNRDMVGAITFSPMGDKLLVAHRGAGVVDILDPFTLTRLGGYQGVGVGLSGMVVMESTLWVLADWDRVLVGYDLGAGNAQVEVGRVSLVETEPLDATLLLGGRLFHAAGDVRMSQDGYLSCASCHLDGDADGQTWDFTDRGEGLRNTLPLFAMPPEGPFHWSANFDELQDFENDIRLHQGGGGFLSEEDWALAQDTLGESKAGRSEELDALAAYVQSLAGQVPRSPWREASGELSAEAVTGELLFISLGCEECHSGESYTDAALVEGVPVLHDVGTLLSTSGGRLGGELMGLRTPGLRGLHASAPYLHDGRAETLKEALVAHGVVLGEEDMDILVRFLLEI